VLRPGRSPQTARFVGDDKESTLHFSAFEGEELAGVVSYFLSEEEPFVGHCQLRGMAVSPSCRGKGVGKQLVTISIDQIAKAVGVTNFWCNARIEARPFYRQLGLVDFCEIFWVSGIGPHIKMTFSL
jgi:predicted GNAT family N-acyltransferase